MIDSEVEITISKESKQSGKDKAATEEGVNNPAPDADAPHLIVAFRDQYN